MNFQSFNDLMRCLEANLSSVRDADLFVGIPRSGLLVAHLLALQLHKPMAELNGFLRGNIISAGKRLTSTPEQYSRVVIIDDSALTGAEMRNARKKVLAAGLAEKVRFGCVYADARAMPELDFWFEQVPYPRLFEWNIFHHTMISEACVDMDGVLCHDPTGEENDEGERYELFLQDAKPRFLPEIRIGAIVTCRLEKYRAQTERWLEKHKVRYSKLIMMPCQSKAERLAMGHGVFKAGVYGSGKFRLFLESSLEQSKEIFSRTNRPVFCVEQKCMLARSDADLIIPSLK